MEAMTTNEAARAIGVSSQRIRMMISLGQLRAGRFGRALAIDARDVRDHAARRNGMRLPAGRPVCRPVCKQNPIAD